MSATRPLVTAVIPAYNAEKTIEVSLRSALRQTYRSLDIVVVDDGSTDRTAAIAAGVDRRVRVFRKENGGPASARNVGLEAAEGDFVAFLDADDAWDDDKTERQLALFAQNEDLAWVYGGARYVRDWGTIAYELPAPGRHLPEGDILRTIFVTPIVPTLTVIVRRTVARDIGGFDERDALRELGEDWEFWLRLAAKYPVGRIDAPVATYRLSEDSLSHAIGYEKRLGASLLVVEEAIHREGDRLRGLENVARAACFRRAAEQALGHAEGSPARKSLWEAFTRSPELPRDALLWLAAWLPAPILRGLLRSRRRLAGRRRSTRVGDTETSW